LAAAFAAFLIPTLGHAADVTRATSAPVFAGSSLSVEIYGGYLTGTAGEYVYNVPGNGTKLSQLNWQIDNAAILGGRLTYRPFDWLNLRLGGWSVVASGNAQDDFDWFRGYNGFDSWTDWSHSGVTEIAKAYQIDVSAAARLHQFGSVEISGLAGYRFLTLKMNDFGGHFIYSTNGGFRNDVGTFDPNELGIAYQQWWHTPYLGVGAIYSGEKFKLTAELIGSPLVMARDKDHHNSRNLVFKERFTPSWMLGATLAVEYALSAQVALTARADYQRYFEARGGTDILNGESGRLERLPKPAAGGDFDALALTMGLKVSL
jgi:outer membrane protease